MLFEITKKQNKKRHGIHITHNDADAVGCALVLSYYYPEFDFQDNTYFCSIGTQSGKVDDLIEKMLNGEEEMPESIVISDISLAERTCQSLEDFCLDNNIDLIAFDHHLTNNLDNDYDWWVISREPVRRAALDAYVDISATLLMYNYYGNRLYNTIDNRPLNMICTMISDYDTWTWRKFPNLYKEQGVDADIVGIVCSLLKPEKMFKSLYNYYCDGKIRYKTMMFPDLFYTLYEIETENKDRYLKTLQFKTKVFSHNNFNFGLFICENSYSNAAAEYLYNNYDFIDIVMILYPSSKKIGLRTKRNDINLGDIAKKYYHGGGHPSAAGGFFIEDSEYADLMKLFYVDAVSLDNYIENKTSE